MPIYSVANVALFGNYLATASDLPTTTLPLALQGTVVALDNPAQSLALISANNGKTKPYKIGSVLSGNATIMQIEKNNVVINHNGALEKIPLPVQLVALNERPTEARPAG